MGVAVDMCLGSLCNARKHLSCSILKGETRGPDTPVSPSLGMSGLFNANPSTIPALQLRGLDTKVRNANPGFLHLSLKLDCLVQEVNTFRNL